MAVSYKITDKDFKELWCVLSKDAFVCNENLHIIENICRKNGIDEDTATKIFDQMEKFASYGFNKYDFYRSDAVDTIVTLSVPSRTVLFQMGLAGRHWDWKVYYKFYANNKKYINGDKGSLGTAFTYYF